MRKNVQGGGMLNKSILAVLVAAAAFLSIGATIKKATEGKLDVKKEVKSTENNILYNGDFTEKQNELPVGFKKYPYPAGAKFEYSYDSDMPFTGGLPVIKIVAADFIPNRARGTIRFQSFLFKIERGKSYMIALWMRSDVSHSVVFGFDGWSEELRKIAGDKWKHYHSYSGKGEIKDEWKELTCIIKIPDIGNPNCIDELEEVFLAVDLENGTFWIANMRVIEVPKEATAAPEKK